MPQTLNGTKDLKNWFEAVSYPIFIFKWPVESSVRIKIPSCHIEEKNSNPQ